MATYVDKDRPLETPAEFRRLLAASPYLMEYVPALHQYVETYPKGFNTYDSLGEALLASGDREGAIRNYRRSLELNPENKSAEEALKKLGK